jgi:flagellar biosynthetic protein FlhB
MVLVVAWQSAAFLGLWRALWRRTLDAAIVGGLDRQTPLVMWSSLAVFRATGIAITLSWMAALGSAMAQGGLVFAPSALAFQPARLNPGAKLKQLFSLPSLGRLLKSLLPGAVIAYITGSLLASHWNSMLGVPRLGAAGVASSVLELVFEISWKSALVLLLWSGADLLIERQKLSSDLRMSKQELRDEYKETEGNPAIKARIRRLQRQVRRRRMLEEVKRAAVVIVNPTEFAIALAFDPLMAAPVVVAKGRNLFAQQIKQAARWQGIPVVENPPLAHALYRAVEIGQSIPPKLYTAVAEILAAIYRAQQRAAQPSMAHAVGGR